MSFASLFHTCGDRAPPSTTWSVAIMDELYGGGNSLFCNGILMVVESLECSVGLNVDWTIVSLLWHCEETLLFVRRVLFDVANAQHFQTHVISNMLVNRKKNDHIQMANNDGRDCTKIVGGCSVVVGSKLFCAECGMEHKLGRHKLVRSTEYCWIVKLTAHKWTFHQSSNDDTLHFGRCVRHQLWSNIPRRIALDKRTDSQNYDPTQNPAYKCTYCLLMDYACKFH